MNRLQIRLILIWVVSILIGINGKGEAANPYINIDLQFDKASMSYNVGEQIGVDITVQNVAGHDLPITEGFQSQQYVMRMRVMDPTGRLLTPSSPGTEPTPGVHEEPYTYDVYNGIVVRVSDCEILPADYNVQQTTVDLRDYYSMELPGFYSIEVQLSPTIFKDAICNASDYEWQGMARSQPRQIYVYGQTEVEVLPKQWVTGWAAGQDPFPNVSVHIYPRNNMTVSAYDLSSLRLNNIPPVEKFVRFSDNLQTEYLVARFNKQAIIGTFGNLETDNWYHVSLVGRLANGTPFGGSQDVRLVVNADDFSDGGAVVDPGILALYSLEKMEVEFDKGAVHLNGNVSLSAKDYFQVPLEGTALISISTLQDTVNQQVAFELKGDQGQKWEYRDTDGAGVDNFRVDWQGAGCEVQHNKTKLKFKHFASDSASVLISYDLSMVPQSVTIGDVTVTVDEKGGVSVAPEYLIDDLDIDNDGEIEFELQFPVTMNMVLGFNQDGDVLETTVAENYSSATGRFEVMANFDPGELDGLTQPASASVELMLGGQYTPGPIKIGSADWKKISDKQWKYMK